MDDIMDINIQNMVASTSSQGNLDLPKISMMIEHAEYNPDRFPGLIFKLKEPKTTLLLFSSGKIVCTGAKSVEMVERSVHTALAEVEKIGIEVTGDPDIKIQNIVATSDLKAELNLDSIALTLGLERVEYEPEQFPGLVFRVGDPKVVLLLFGSGKVVSTGAKKIEDVEISLELVSRELKQAGLI
ncbi:MAG: TATA-box-binding protein [Candidatus Thermoplasmatota archaeon]|nr:TATA-box-binding protein [Candidatus Thermoplasmatota archaeon]